MDNLKHRESTESPLSANINTFTPEELSLYTENLSNMVTNLFQTTTREAVLLADLLSLQRLSNTCQLLLKKQAKPARPLYSIIMEALWNLTQQKEPEFTKLKEFESLQDIAELLACGTPEDFKEDYIRPFCEKYFPDLITGSGEHDISLIEMEFITCCSGFLLDLESINQGLPPAPTVFCELIDLAQSITQDTCYETKQNIYTHPYFIKELIECRNDCLTAYEAQKFTGTKHLHKIQTDYTKKHFMELLYRP